MDGGVERAQKYNENAGSSTWREVSAAGKVFPVDADKCLALTDMIKKTRLRP